MIFGPNTSFYIFIILVISFFIAFPVGITAIFLQPEEKLVNGNSIYSYDTKINLAIAAGVLGGIPFVSFLLYMLLT
jgi:uncharacterized oligopeptide transporter (OPT) family protein